MLSNLHFKLSVYCKVIIYLIFSTLSFQAASQTCINCQSVCAPCAGGGYTTFTLRFNQSVAQPITAEDVSGQVFSGTVNPNGTFTFAGSIANEKFVGDKVTLKISGSVDVTIITSCSNSILAGNTYGNFTVVAGQSKSGGAICCSPSATDPTPPVITNIPSGTIVESITTPGICSRTINWSLPMATDDCGIKSFTSTHKPNESLFPSGQITKVTYTAEANSGRTTDASFFVEIIDNAPPVFIGCQDITMKSSDTLCGEVVLLPITAIDCDGLNPIITTSPPIPTGNFFSVTSTTMTYSARDSYNNVTSPPCTFIVKIEDKTPPVFSSCVPDQIRYLGSSSCKIAVNWTPPPFPTDNCSIIKSLTSDFSRGSLFPLGTTVVTYKAIDNADNPNTCQFKVTVRDTIRPVFIKKPSSFSVEVNGSSCDAPGNWQEPEATDNTTFDAACTQYKVTVTSNYKPTDRLPLGSNLVTYTATDDSGNKRDYSFTVNVIDTTPPVFDQCPTNIELVADPVSCLAKNVQWAIPVPFDFCLDRVVYPVLKPGDNLPIGSHVITYLAFDKSGNPSLPCTFNVNVVDKTGPTFTTSPTDKTEPADEFCQAKRTWALPIAIDNCSSPTSLVNTVPTSADIFSLGTTKLTYTFADNVGNQSDYTFNVTVNDVTPPVFSGCPSDKLIITNLCEAPGGWIEPTASDNCSGIVIPTSYFKPSDMFRSGTTTRVVYKAVDAAGREASCEFNVIVRNESVPVISACPNDIIRKTDETGKAIVTWDEPTASDQCGNVALVASHKPGSEFTIGTTKVTYKSPPNSSGISAAVCEFNVILSYKEIAFEVGKVVTPNDDAFNKDWQIDGIEDFSDNEVLVVDRWGNKIYEASRYDNNKVVWNGTNSSGAVVPTGTYFYSVAISFRGKRVEKKGSVEVVK
jgi:gliding motility-associated-like protein